MRGHDRVLSRRWDGRLCAYPQNIRHTAAPPRGIFACIMARVRITDQALSCSMSEALIVARQTKTKPVFDVTKLRNAAGAKIFERGEDYHADGSVDILTFSNSRVTAQVTGTQLYFVDLACDKGQLSGFCSCPAYVDHGFCKHMVATGL